MSTGTGDPLFVVEVVVAVVVVVVVSLRLLPQKIGFNDPVNKLDAIYKQRYRYEQREDRIAQNNMVSIF